MAYDFDWVTPGLPLAWDAVPLRQPEPYGDHLRPLYNFQEDLAAGDDPSLPAAAADDGDWHELWVSLAASLDGVVTRFAVVADDHGQLCGSVRLLPKALTRPRYGAWDAAAHRRGDSADVLWIGAAAVDATGYADRLPTSLLDLAIDEARRQGKRRVQALAWSDVPTYALWGQAFPWAVYEVSGFRRIAELDGSRLRALPDMLAGHHGGLVEHRVREQLEGPGLSMEAAESFAIVERVIP